MTRVNTHGAVFQLNGRARKLPNHALMAESEVMHEGKVDRDVKVCIFQIQFGEPLPFLKVFEN